MNRFAKDIGFLDDMLPFTCLDFLTTSLMVLGTVVLVCVVNYLVGGRDAGWGRGFMRPPPAHTLRCPPFLPRWSLR